MRVYANRIITVISIEIENSYENHELGQLLKCVMHRVKKKNLGKIFGRKKKTFRW